MRDRSAKNTSTKGATAKCFCGPTKLAKASRRSCDSTAITLQVCKFDEVGADCAAATSVSSVCSGNASRTKWRTERWLSIASSTGNSGKFKAGAASP